MTLENHPFLDINKELIATRNNLPHWEQDGVLQFITIHLYDSIPASSRKNIVEERNLFELQNPKPWTKEIEQKAKRIYNNRISELLDAGYGQAILSQKNVCAIVKGVFEENNGIVYDLMAYVIMPNHAHVLAYFHPGVKMKICVDGWKGKSGNKINKLLGTEGHVWHKEMFDTIIRNWEHYNNVLKYICKNLRQGGINYGGYELFPYNSSTPQLAHYPWEEQ